jgi:hypothetical protein
MPIARREGWLLGAAAALALAVPAAAARHLDHRVQVDLAPTLADALGEPVIIDHLEVGLTGTLRVRGVRLGDLAGAASVEASLDPGALLAGHLRAAEVRVERPRLALTLSGEDDRLRRALRRAADRLRPRGTDGSAGGGRLRRVVVTGGELELDLGDRGTIAVSGVTLHPQRGGVRAVARGATIDLAAGALAARGNLGRIGADIDLIAVRVERLLGVGGRLAVSAGDAAPLELVRVSAAAGIDDQPGLLVAAESASRGALELRLTPEAMTVRALDLPIAVAGPFLPRALDVTDARAEGSLRVELDPGTRAVTAELALRELRIDDRRVAATAFAVDAGLTLAATATGPALDVERARRELGALALSGRGRAVRGEHRWLPDRAELEIELPATGCAEALAAIPLPLRERLVGLDLRGEVAGTLALAFDRQRPRDTVLRIDDRVGCRVGAEPATADVRTLAAPFPHRFPDGQRRTIGAGPDHTPLARLPHYVPDGFVAAEDARFFGHHGFDRHQIERSLAVDLAEAGVVRGGSTISQQLVKNLFLTPDRSIARKLQEAILAWRLEAHIGKRVILSRYLEIIELGPGVFGVTAAARHWFGKEPTELSPREAAFLIALTPAPRTISARVAGSGGVDWQTAHRVKVILGLLHREGVLSTRQHQRALADRLTLRPAVLARN